MSVVSAAVLSVMPVVELDACASELGEGFARQLTLEWPDAPEGARLEVRCDGPSLQLHLEATGFVARDERVDLPDLSANARGRVLALLVAERGRRLARQRTPLAPTEPAGARPPEPESAPRVTGQHRAVWTVFDLVAVPLEWRLSAGGFLARPLWLGPTRAGPRVLVGLGPFALVAAASFGREDVTLGSIQAQAFELEPQVVLLALRLRWFEASLRAGGTAGYGVLRAATTELATGGSIQGVLLGGNGVLAVALRVSAVVSIELEGSLGFTWGPFARAGGRPSAALGGGAAAVGLNLVVDLEAR